MCKNCDTIHQQVLALSAIAAELSDCNSQDELFSELGRRLHQLGFESLILLRTSDRTALRPAYTVAAEFYPERLRAIEQLFGRPWRQIELSTAIPCALNFTLSDGRVRFVETVLDDLEHLAPDTFALHRQQVEQVFPAWRAMYIPLQMSQQFAGVLVVLAQHLSETDIPVLSAFANLLSALLESVRRLEGERRRAIHLALANRVLQEVNAAPPTCEGVASAIERALVADTPFEYARLLIREKDALIAPTGGGGERKIKLADEPFASAFSTGRPLCLNNPEQADWLRSLGVACGMHALMIVPLLGGPEGDQPAGALCIASSEPNAFQETEQEFFETVSRHLVTALYTVRLFERMDTHLERRVAELNALLDMGRAVVSSLNPEEVLLRLLTLTAKWLDVERAAFIEVDAEAGEMRVLHLIGLPYSDQVELTRPLAGTLTEVVTRERRIVCIPDTRVPGWYSSLLTNWWGGIVPPNLLFAPLIHGNQAVGALGYSGKIHGTFTEQDVEFVRAASLWATIALENAQLYHEIQTKSNAFQQAIFHIGEMLTGGGDLNSILRTVLGLGQVLVNADAAFIDLLSTDGTYLRPFLSHDLPPHLQDMRFPVDSSIDGEPIRTGRPVALEDALADPRLLYREWASSVRMRSTIIAPLRKGEDKLGVLGVFRNEIHPFTEEEIQLLQTLANQAAVALEQARRAEALREQAAYLNAVLEGTSEAVFVVDGQGRVEFINPAGREILQGMPHKPGAWLGDETFYGSSEEASHARRLGERVLQNDMTPYEIEFGPKGQERRRLRVRPSIITPNQRYVLIATDITAERRLDRQRYDFLRRIYHELRTPLAAALGFLEILLDQRGIPLSKQYEMLEVVYGQTQRLKTLLEELQVFTLLGEPAVPQIGELAHVGQVIGQVLEEARRTYPTIEFVEYAPADLPPASCDYGTLFRATRHLISTIVKLSPPGSIVEVRATPRQKYVKLLIHGRKAHLPSQQVNGVINQPLGTLDEQLEHQFPGVGLGLALVRRAIEKIGGRLEICSSGGAGSALIITLPIAETSSQSPE